MHAPKLDINKCSVLIAELATGHIFKKDLTLFLKGDNELEVYQLFDNFHNAQSFALDFIMSKPEFECVIYNHNGEHLKTYDITGERKFANNDQE